MASRGALGGLSEATLQAALLMDASGKDDVFIETVGVGQAEIDIVDHGDTIVLVLMPGSGDSIQALKAGVMEIPDVIVRQQGRSPDDRHDDPRDPRRALARARRPRWRVPILRTEAAKGEGVAELAEKIAEHREHIEAEGTLEERRARNLRNEVLELAAARMRRRLEAAVADDSSDRRAARPRRQAGARSRQRRQGAAGARGWLTRSDRTHGQAVTPEPRRGARLGRQADRRPRRARPRAASPASTSTPRTASRAGC